MHKEYYLVTQEHVPLVSGHFKSLRRCFILKVSTWNMLKVKWSFERFERIFKLTDMIVLRSLEVCFASQFLSSKNLIYFQF